MFVEQPLASPGSANKYSARCSLRYTELIVRTINSGGKTVESLFFSSDKEKEIYSWAGVGLGSASYSCWPGPN